jgi:hypothetical protein
MSDFGITFLASVAVSLVAEVAKKINGDDKKGNGEPGGCSKFLNFASSAVGLAAFVCLCIFTHQVVKCKNCNDGLDGSGSGGEQYNDGQTAAFNGGSGCRDEVFSFAKLAVLYTWLFPVSIVLVYCVMACGASGAAQGSSRVGSCTV